MIQDRRLSLSLMIAALAVAIGMIWGAMESHYRSCISQAVARYPAVPVSALATRDTGPLKLSFVAERQRAIKGCNRLPIL